MNNSSDNYRGSCFTYFLICKPKGFSCKESASFYQARNPLGPIQEVQGGWYIKVKEPLCTSSFHTCT